MDEELPFFSVVDIKNFESKSYRLNEPADIKYFTENSD